MTADLLERDQFLSTLDEALWQATDGHGRVALISGEAGIGKTALVERFLERRPAGVRTLWGACEALFTPRPLGPLYDIAQQTTSPIRSLLEGEVSRSALFAAVWEELADDAAPTITVIEDIHWADEATLDLVKYLARRIHRIPCLLILSWRDDEIDSGHPLRHVLGDLRMRDVTRLRLPPLSEVAVTALAHKAARSAHELYATTGGNPFFLTEVLASDTPGVPTSVADAVFARIARRSTAAQRLVEVVAVVPNRIDLWLLRAVSAEKSDTLEECLAAGVLHLEGESVGFRHELARQAVEGALSPARQQALHAAILQALLARGEQQIEVARLVHHAALAQDAEQTLRFATLAARQASKRGAHRQAVEQYRTALRFAGRLEPDERAYLLEELSHECLLTGHMSDAIQAGEDALAIWRQLDVPQRSGHSLRWLSRVYWYAARRSTANHYIELAAHLLEALPSSKELGWAYNYRAMFAMLAEETGAQEWCDHAFAMAQQLGDDELVSHAFHTRAMAQLYAGDAMGRDQVEASLRLAIDHDLEDDAGRAYSNLTCYLVRYRKYADAHECIATGMAYCSDRDLDLFTYQMMSWKALAALEQGNWALASEDATTVVHAEQVPPIIKIQALVTLGWIRARRGDPGADALLDEAHELALGAAEIQRVAPVMAARAEVAWLRGDLTQCAAEARFGFDLACAHENPWALGQLAFWLWRAGALTEPPSGASTPYALQISGDWRAAAVAWEEIGCPYEQALALLDGDEAALRDALTIFERLGAGPALEIVRKRLRQTGARGLPRGPRPSTRGNPYGLTSRQLEILLLLVEGLHNAEMAERLSTTLKTVEHHVTAVLAKLNARSRAEAVSIAYDSGLFSQGATVSPPPNIRV